MVFKNQKDNYLTFGIESKSGSFFFRFPWYTAFIFFLLVEIVIFLIERNFEVLLRSAILLLTIIFLNLLIAYKFTKNYCYKIQINIDQDTIKFFKFFNHGTNIENLKNVGIIVHKTCDLVFHDNSYTVFPKTLQDNIPYLPRNTEVVFSGFFGKLKQKDWKRRNINLTPGTN